jgi:methionyl-tRNA synthetase
LGIDVPVEGAKGKNYTCGLMPLLDISRLQKNGRYVKEKWNRTGKIKTQAGSFYRHNVFFSLHYFPAMLKAEGSYILPDNVPANEFLNLEGNKLSTKNWAVWLHEYGRFPRSARCFALRIDI